MGVVRSLLLLPALALVAACGSSSETSTAPSQIRCHVDARADTVAFAPDGGSSVVRITAARECTWVVQSEASWVTMSSPASGQGNANVAFRVGSNSDPVSRSGVLAVGDQRIALSQDARPCTYQVSSTLETVEAAGGERTLEVTASNAQCRWTATSDAAWIAVAAGREGSGNGSVRLNVAALDGPARAGSVTVAGQVVRVEQGSSPAPGCSVTVGATAFGFGAAGGKADVPIEAPAGCEWSAERQSPWIEIIGSGTGRGSGNVRFQVSPWDGPERTGALIVAGRTVTVTQSAGCSLIVNPASISVGAEGNTRSVQVATAAGCAWSATSGAPWIAITAGASGSGGGEVQFTVAGNPGPARAGSLTIGGRTIAVSQASGCSYALSPRAQDVPGGGGSGTVTVTTAAGCSWTASSHVDWIAPAATSGTGPGQLAFTVAANSGPARTGTFVAAGQTFTVRQPSPCSWTFVPPSHAFDANGGNGAILVLVTGPCTWTAVSNASWITVTSGASGTGNGLVQFAAAANTGPARTGTLTIGGERYDVAQAGK